MNSNQNLVFYPYELKLSSGPNPDIEVQKKPDRLWTLFREKDKTKKPALPIMPVHFQNAFLEDFVHDWDWHEGRLRYYSRVTDGFVWLLLEYD